VSPSEEACELARDHEREAQAHFREARAAIDEATEALAQGDGVEAAKRGKWAQLLCEEATRRMHARNSLLIVELV
jgi:hypothetical protein